MVTENIQKKISGKNKLDFLATKDDDNTPHITVLNSLQLYNADTLLWGQMCEGASKKNLRARPQNGFMVLTPQNEIIRGTSIWRDAKRTGTEYDILNSDPDIHYNAYYSLTCVHFMDLAGIEGISEINFEAVAKSHAKTLKAAAELSQGKSSAAMNTQTAELFLQSDSIKVMSYITDKGDLKIIPVFQAAPASNNNRIIFATDLFTDEITAIPENAYVAVYCISRTGVKYSVLVKGKFSRKVLNGIELGTIDVDKVYNPMLPAIGYIYPAQPLIPVREFKDAIDV